MKTFITLIFLLAFTVTANAADKNPILAMQFNTICGVCTNGAAIYPLEVAVHSGTSTNGGVIQGVTLTFRCVRDKTPAQKRCRKTFKQDAKIFVPTPPMATLVGAGMPPVPDDAKSVRQQDTPFKHHWSYGNPITTNELKQ